MGLQRRARAARLLVLIFLLIGFGRAEAVTPWDPWKDLLNMLPDPTPLNAARQVRGQASISFKIQRVEDATGEHINFDTYSVEVIRLPTGVGADLLFQKVRRDLNDFMDSREVSVEPYRSGDGKDWKSSANAPLGSIMVWHVPPHHLFHEEMGVVTSLSEQRRWIFTTVTIGRALPGEHPVSGNREFGLRAGPGGGWTIYTRAADRVLASIFPGEDIVLAGGDRLWRSWQKAVAEYVNAAGGRPESSLS
jgi:hypothetical protein